MDIGFSYKGITTAMKYLVPPNHFVAGIDSYLIDFIQNLGEG